MNATNTSTTRARPVLWIVVLMVTLALAAIGMFVLVNTPGGLPPCLQRQFQPP